MAKKKRIALKRAARARATPTKRASARKVEHHDSADIERAVYDGMQDLRARGQ